MTYQNYEFTAFREADLLKDGDHSIGHGDRFTMPGDSTVTLSVRDDDNELSKGGSNRSADWSQDGYIDGVKIGRDNDLYADRVHIVEDENGNQYRLIEVAVENHNAAGNGDDYFTFEELLAPAIYTLVSTMTRSAQTPQPTHGRLTLTRTPTQSKPKILTCMGSTLCTAITPLAASWLS